MIRIRFALGVLVVAVVAAWAAAVALYGLLPTLAAIGGVFG